MSKAILVLDMPTRCEDCILYCENKHMEDVCVGMEYRVIEEMKPEWCPLRPIPNKKQDAYNMVMPNGQKYRQIDKIAKGYNQCLDEIMGEEN